MQAYNAAGNIPYIKYGNDKYDTRTYSNQQVMTSATMIDATKTSSYTYDKNMNIGQLVSNHQATRDNKYDDFDRLNYSDSGLSFSGCSFNKYGVETLFDAVHNLTTKNQRHKVDNVNTENSHNFQYTYNTSSTHPHAPSVITETPGAGGASIVHSYTYDGDGNRTLESKQTGTNPADNRNFYWDEQDRLEGVTNFWKFETQKLLHHYIYDAGGVRVIRSTGDAATTSINNGLMEVLTHQGVYTQYPNELLTVGQYSYSKHYYAGSTRVASGVHYGTFESPSSLSALKPGLNAQAKAKQDEQRAHLKALYRKAGLPAPVFPKEEGLELRDEETEEECATYLLLMRLKHIEQNNTACLNIIDNLFNPPFCQAVANLQTQHPECVVEVNPTEEYMFWYHGDHLGSSAYLTNEAGNISHHYEYLPWGELMHSSEVNELPGENIYANRYKFSGKEFDEETGNYYFGARYYEPGISQWLSVDPKFIKYPNASPYNYVLGNPTKFVDPNGMEVELGELYKKDRHGNLLYKEQVEAFEHFAGTKEGQEFLSNYASAGQVIAGHEYKKSGKYHKAGIDIAYREYNASSQDTRNGYTDKEFNNGRLKLIVNTSSQLGVTSKLMNVIHESYIHGNQYSEDFISDRKLDNSNIPKYISDYSNKFDLENPPAYMQHINERQNRLDLKSKGMSIMSQYYKNTGNLPFYNYN